MYQGSGLPQVVEELVALAFSGVSTWNEAGDID
jgi:hypothetical protein